MNVRTRGGGDKSLDERAVETLRASLLGRLLGPGSPEYDDARTIWNAMIDRRPALIARCASPRDVIRSIAFARENDLVVAVRGGGHNVAGNAVCEGGFMIDLSPMKTVEVDPDRRTARVAAGATLADVDRETQNYGLATPLGINSTTGIAGLTLGGGFGWLSRRLGLTIDNLLSAELVTPSGEMTSASESENPDLFWAIRGGGGNFGVVTSFVFRLHEIGPEVLSGLVLHPFDDARNILRFYREFVRDTPEGFVCWFVLRKAPPAPFIPEGWHGREILALAMCHSGDAREGEEIARPLRSFGRPIVDLVNRGPYTAWQSALDPLLAPGARNYWKSHDFMELGDGLIDALLAQASRLPDPQTEIAFVQLGGAVSRVSNEQTAYSHRDPPFTMNVHGRWSDPAKDGECIAWTKDVFRATAPFSTGSVYVNFMTQDEQDRIRAAYGENYARLSHLKGRYDPLNLLRMNQNIAPEP